MSIDILYEDHDVLVINKPSGMAIEGPIQEAWPAHRLDKDTSGVLVLAKTADVLTYLRQQFKERQVAKEYLALVFGVPKKGSGRIDRPLKRSTRYPMRRTIHPDGKPAVTDWQVEETFGEAFALLRLTPLTGRTHQLRAHLHWLGHPVIGDKLYTFKKLEWPSGVPAPARQMLHAAQLTLQLPSGDEKTFTAREPVDFVKTCHDLRNAYQSAS